MFRLKEPAVVGAQGPRRFLARALFFALGLGLLWGALQLMPIAPAAPLPVSATPDAAPSTGLPATVGATTPDLFGPGYLAVLAILAGGIGLALYLRRSGSGGPATDLPLRALGQLQMTPGQHLRLVGCGDDVLLLGVTAGQITLLKTYAGEALTAASAVAPPAPTETAPAPAMPEPAAAAPTHVVTEVPDTFARVLRRYAGQPVNVHSIR